MAVGVLGLFFLLTSSGRSQGVASDYVGNDVCKACHPNVAAPFYKNPHFRSSASGEKASDKIGCESCHGPGRAHVKAGGGKATILAFSETTPKKTLETCLRCHAETLARSNIRRSTHTLNDVVCTNCHSIHKPATPKLLLAESSSELCYGCHANVRAQFSMPFKHRVNEGFMTCTDCHNPHGGFAPTWRMAARPRLVNQAMANEEPCLKCHTEKRGPFTFEHPPVRVDGCETCHSPHGSMNSRLLRRPVVFTLCLECHTGVEGFGTFGAGIPTQSSGHNMADPRYQNCTNCHVRIHGSNTSELFLR